ncbi:YggS family pyridoxal phosphate-dependent enzyme [Paracoccus sp. (in: a-proteobacteria)]|uniref:YggS family pyridoxal phosphate-dependent enzyme n=1 Tax=Paracoccus sp. TaxID=267 RepID=UPI0026E0A96B|nr:YggS family pyridoxal phosphate-dependent enzyme [Paracoccus sp. (in: a-proteobacteria)]MDO5368809.1 YggS family pyridoxal phosphate-dependent enzyme [Paracoccus sp. (in: a-proteobacteria)]
MSLGEIRQRIAAAAAGADRDPAGVTLIAVSKLQPDDRVRAALDAGQRVFGENYVQEAQRKWPGLREGRPGIELHLVGPLQSNKARAAVESFDAIHSLDRPSLARRLARIVQELGRAPQLFVQVNTGDEPQKAGIPPAEADAFIALCRDLYLPLAGCMCIPPDDDDPAPHFRLLRDIARRNGLPGLSMGMSGDFETAIAEGATHVRIGSAIFGARPTGANG